MISAITLKALGVRHRETGDPAASIARVSPETAPLLFTARSPISSGAPIAIAADCQPAGETIFKFAMSPFAECQQLAWAWAKSLITQCIAAEHSGVVSRRINTVNFAARRNAAPNKEEIDEYGECTMANFQFVTLNFYYGKFRA